MNSTDGLRQSAGTFGCLATLVGMCVSVVGSPASGDLVLVPSDADLQQMFSSYSVVPQVGKDIEELEQAYAAFQQQQVDECLAKLTLAHKQHPTLPPPRIMLAVFLLEARQLPQARSLLESVAIEHAEYAPLYEMFGRLAVLEGRLTDALVLIDRAVRLAGQTDWETARRERFLRQCELGLAAVAEGRQDWQTAREHLESALKRRSDDAPSRRRLAQALFYLDEPQLAYAELLKVPGEDKSLEPPEVMMARLHSQRGDHEQAEDWLRKAADLHPSRVGVTVTYASWLLDRGRVDEAAATIGKAAEAAPDNLQVKSLLGILARFRKEHEQAERYFQELLNDQPASFDYRNQLALALIEQPSEQKRHKALQLAEVNARQYPNASPALATLGWVYYRLGRTADAQRVLQAAISGGRATSETAYYLARVMADAGELDQARRLLTGALETDGRFLHRDEAQAWLERISTKPRQTQADNGNNDN